jgi:hypothetical protein
MIYRNYSYIISLALCLVAIYLYIEVKKRDEPATRQVCRYSLETLNEIVEDGDIITRLGSQIWSNFIRDVSVDDRRFSHVGIVRVVEDLVSVIHAEGTVNRDRDMVKEESLESFLSVARSVGLYRYTGDIERSISDISLNFLGMPFDWSFELADSTRVYCTELVYKVIKQIEPDINFHTIFMKEINRNIIPIEAISNSINFEEKLFLKL